MTGKHLGNVLFCAFVGFWLSRALFGWILGVDGTARWALMGAGALIGAMLAVAAVRAEAAQS